MRTGQIFQFSSKHMTSKKPKGKLAGNCWSNWCNN